MNAGRYKLDFWVLSEDSKTNNSSYFELKTNCGFEKITTAKFMVTNNKKQVFMYLNTEIDGSNLGYSPDMSSIAKAPALKQYLDKACE